MRKKAMQIVIKPFRDLALVLYDDLEFKAMSLPRIAAVVVTAVVLVSWAAEQFFSLPYEHFDALAGVCGGIWASYGFKKWVGRGEGHGRNNDDESSVEDEAPAK